MERTEILAKMRDALADQLGIDAEKVTEDASLTNDLGADSLDLLEMVTAMEDEFSISIPDEDFEKIATVGDAIDEVERLTA